MFDRSRSVSVLWETAPAVQVQARRLREPFIWFIVGGFTGLAAWYIRKRNKEAKIDKKTNRQHGPGAEVPHPVDSTGR